MNSGHKIVYPQQIFLKIEEISIGMALMIPLYHSNIGGHGWAGEGGGGSGLQKQLNLEKLGKFFLIQYQNLTNFC